VVQELEEDALLFVRAIFLSMIEPIEMLVTKHHCLIDDLDSKKSRHVGMLVMKAK
jgi:hypothetical protein